MVVDYNKRMCGEKSTNGAKRRLTKQYFGVTTKTANQS
jgi:hypothetical protein